MNLFNRILKVAIIRQDLGVDYSFSTTVRREIAADLKVEVSINASNKKNTDGGHVKIWNASKETCEFIKPNVGGIIEITAGYGDESAMIFRGAIGRTLPIIVDRDGTETILKFSLGSYIDKIKNARVSLAYNGSVTAEQILRDALNKAGVRESGLKESFPSKIEVRNFSYAGGLVELIQNFIEERKLGKMGIRAYPKNGMYIFENETNSQGREVHEVSAATGLLDPPRWVNDDNKPVYKLKTLLNPKISIGSVINVISSLDKKTEGRFVVSKIDYDLTTHDDDFMMKIEAKQA